MEKLKPCPFCGGKALFCIKENRTTNCGVGFVFEVECEECRMRLPGRYVVDFNLQPESGEIDVLNDRRQAAIEAWNRRI
ncbi:MAG: Lar family restriction alleviation protein [Clostridiaceae bacterium]|nr:Lar family restriction alleviation protein [Clostridiaceae bacterium]